ncbi:hypothetical protein [Arthrobacter koreensis]|uniref:hypothetical protein n=1 Tax=Arthrobacter koreensis TaxID=199136 RepID=UPI00381A8EFC
MMGALKQFLGRKPRTPAPPACIWAGEHSGEPICYVVIERDCGHFERDKPACLNHVNGLLANSGLADKPAPCYRTDCNVVSVARVAHTTDIPGRQYA